MFLFKKSSSVFKNYISVLAVIDYTDTMSNVYLLNNLDDFFLTATVLTICKVNDYPGIMGVMVTIKLLYYLDFLIFKQFKHLYFKKCLRLQVTTNVNTFCNALVFFHIQYTVASQRKAMSRIYR